MSTFHDYADLLTADQLDLDVPDCEVVSVAVEATEAQKQAVDALVERAELVRDGAVDPSDDNMLNITNDGRKVSLDPKLLDVSDPDIQPMEGGKVQVCAEKIHEIWREHAEEKATQLVFCDSSTTASGKWNIQSDLKRRLVDLGIPADEIMFAVQEKDPQRKQALFEKVRKGEVRVLIGSTGTLAPVRTCRTGSSPSTTSTVHGSPPNSNNARAVSAGRATCSTTCRTTGTSPSAHSTATCSRRSSARPGSSARS